MLKVSNVKPRNDYILTFLIPFSRLHPISYSIPNFHLTSSSVTDTSLTCFINQSSIATGKCPLQRKFDRSIFKYTSCFDDGLFFSPLPALHYVDEPQHMIVSTSQTKKSRFIAPAPCLVTSLIVGSCVTCRTWVLQCNRRK